MKNLELTLTYPDATGEPITETFNITYNESQSGLVTCIEFVSASNGGPIMRPKKPRD